jgi:hypothetical protein
MGMNDLSAKILSGLGSVPDHTWRFLTGESINLKEAGEQIVKQAAEAPTRKQQLAQLEYAKHIWEDQLASVRGHWRPCIMLSICCYLVLIFVYPYGGHRLLLPPAFGEPILGFLIGFVLYQSGLERSKSRFRSEIERCNKAMIALGVEGLGNRDEFFTRLVTINFNYLDLYYRQTKSQAEKSFWVSVVAAVVGFGMVIAGICLLYGKQISSGYVTIASGAISQFIAAVFFYLYNRTILSMSQYHQKLVVTQNVSLALKTAESLPDPKKADAQVGIIEQLTRHVNAYLLAARLPADEKAPSRGARKRISQTGGRPHAAVRVNDAAKLQTDSK